MMTKERKHDHQNPSSDLINQPGRSTGKYFIRTPHPTRCLHQHDKTVLAGQR